MKRDCVENTSTPRKRAYREGISTHLCQTLTNTGARLKDNQNCLNVVIFMYIALTTKIRMDKKLKFLLSPQISSIP